MNNFRQIDNNGNLVFGPILPEDIPTHSHVAVDVTDFYNQVQEDTKNLICCKQVVYQEDLSAFPTANALNAGDLIYGDVCYYFRVRMQANVSIEPPDNDLNYNFKLDGIYVCFLTKNALNDPWTFEYAKSITEFNATSMYIDHEFIYTSAHNKYVSILLSTTGIDNGMEVTPINNLNLFWAKLTVTKCPKTSWFKRFTIADTGWLANAEITGLIPSSGYLPFTGFYSVDAYFQVREAITINGEYVNVTTMQTLEIREQGETYIQIDRSGIFEPGTPNEGEKWMNKALQGSSIFELLNTANKLEYRVYLPNGLQKKIEGGYVHLKYIGSAESISL